MRLGLVGLPMSGKTTIFNALTGSDRPMNISAPGKLEVQMAVVNVPDPRLDQLTSLFHPEKKTNAHITYTDIGGITKGINSGGLSGPFRNEISQMDALLHIIRVFDNPNVPHTEETIDPQRDLDLLETEFILTDLVTVETRLSRLKREMNRGKKQQVDTAEVTLFERLQAVLEEGTPLRDMELSPKEHAELRGYGFLSLKPKLILLNCGEELVNPHDVIAYNSSKTVVIALQGQLEMEIAQLEGEDAELFMTEYGITEAMRDRAIAASYALLSVQTFFTVGEDEVRAWTHDIGSRAQVAAGKIHSDLERGFIAAEVMPWDLLVELGGLPQAKQAGKLRIEGKNYIVQDGEVMSVRFNV